ncbi:MAG: O-antigen ligase family protein [Candidatus Moraniibacteriota bacterium]
MKKIFKLENLIYLTIFALPTYLLRFNLGGLPVNMLDCLLFMSVLLGLVIYRKKIQAKLFFEKNKLIFFSVSLIFLGLILSVLINKNYALSLGIIKSWFVLPVLFALIVRCLPGEAKFKNIFWAYYLSAFFVASISLVYYFSGFITYDLRLQGFYNSPNYLAMYLAPAIFVGYYLFSEVKIKTKAKLLSLFFNLIILFALYLTYSYASWLAILIAFGFVLLLEKKLNWKKSLFVAFFALMLFFSQLENNKFFNLMNFNGRSSFSSRIMIWQSAEKIGKDNWFLGIGIGNFQEKYLAYQKYFPTYLEWDVPHPHNLYLAFWLYGGVFGLAGFLGLIYIWFSGIVKAKINPSLRFMVLGIMFYILLHGLVDTTYFKNDLAVIFWLLFSLL